MQSVKAGQAAVLALLLTGALLPVVAADGQATPARRAVNIGIDVIPATLPADSSSHPALVISLVDSSGAPTLSLTDVLVFLTSSNESTAKVPGTVTLLAGRAFVQVDVTSGASPGSTTITAASSGLGSKSVAVSTAAPGTGARSIGLFVSPARSLRGLQGSDLVYAVQLLGSAGGLANSAGATQVVITSSNGSLIAKPIYVTIPDGSSAAYGRITVNSSGSTTLTALAPQLVTATAQLSVGPASPLMTLTATPSDLLPGNFSAVLVSVQVLGMPVLGVSVTVSVNGGSLNPANFVTNQAGQGSSTYLAAAPGAYVVSASALYPRLGLNLSTSTLIVVTRPVIQTGSSSELSPLLALYLPLAAIIAVVAAIVLLVRRTIRRRRGVVEDEDVPPAHV